MRTRSRRRSGVSSVIGAMFFVLVVFLVFSATILVFESFGNYSLLFKGVNQQDAQNRVTDVAVSNLAFGGIIPVHFTPNETLTALPNTASPTRSLLPISNMNFTSGMAGWVFSRDYKIVRDNGTVTNSFQNIIPGATVFSMAVSNNDQSGTCPVTSCIIKVSLQVDSEFSLAGFPALPPPPSWNVPVISGNTISWTAVAGTGIAPLTNPVLFNWTALAPGVPGKYYQTATLTWSTIFHAVQITDEGSVSFETDVVTSGPGGVSIPPLCPPPATWNICAEPAGVIPGGVIGGYDPVSNVVGSESGPGSVYLDFQPTYNGTTITGGQQLTAVMNFTSAFTIDPGQAAALNTGSVDAVNFGYSLDQVTAPPNPLILINQYLVQLTSSDTINAIIQIPNQSPVVPASVNSFSASGWITCGPGSTNCNEPYFDPVVLATQQNQPAWAWTPGLYELVISVTASMPGATPPSADYPSSFLMHFDDIGLSLQDIPLAYFVDSGSAPACPPLPGPNCYLQIPITVDPSQVQSLQLTANLGVSSAPAENVTGYVFLGDVSRGTGNPVWVEVAQLEFSSSATITLDIPAATASAYIDTSGTHCGAVGICARVYAISDGNDAPNFDFGSLTFSVSALVQTYQQNTATVTVLNNSTFPVAFTNVFITGPDGVSNYYLTATCGAFSGVAPSALTPCYVNQGQQLIVQLAPPSSSFGWRTDQTYTATIVTNKGLSFSETFISP